MLSRCSYTIMAILRSKNATNRIRAMTIKEIGEIEQMTRPNTLYLKIQQLLSMGFVDEGVMVGRSKSYYLTESGQKELPEKS